MYRRMAVLLVTVLLAPVAAQAAYQNPTVTGNDRQQNGSTQLTFQFTGNSGEPTVIRQYTVNPASTITALRNWVDGVIAELDLMHTAASLAALQPGQTVPRLAPVPPAPTAKQVWRGKIFRYDQGCKSSFAGAVATACAALKADIESTYAAGFLDE